MGTYGSGDYGAGDYGIGGEGSGVGAYGAGAYGAGAYGAGATGDLYVKTGIAYSAKKGSGVRGSGAGNLYGKTGIAKSERKGSGSISRPGDIAAAMVLWRAAVLAGPEIRSGRLVTFLASKDVTGSVTLTGGAYTIRLASRMSGRYLVASDPRLIESISQSPIFSIVPNE